MGINEPSEFYSENVGRWTTNRDVIAGSNAVRKKTITYLPLAFPDQDLVTQYPAYQKAVSFYPAANRTCDGILGLMMRRDPVAELPDALKDIKAVITSHGDSLETLTRRVCKEVLTTNYCGLVADYSTVSASSKGAAKDGAERAFLNFYPAESILECTPGPVGKRQLPIRVRLLENGGQTVRLMELVDGLVEVKVYHRNDGKWPDESSPNEVHLPKARGQRLTEIPFDLMTVADDYYPYEAPLDNVVALNLDHYIAQSMLTKQILFNLSPMIFVSGIEKSETVIKWVPGRIYSLENAESKVFQVSTPSDSSLANEKMIAALEDKIAVCANRILARQKAVAEAAETEAVRQGAENSVLAMTANAISERFERSLKRAANYTDEDVEIAFQINTDYLPVNISSQEITAMLGLYEAKLMSRESAFYKLREGGMFDETHKWDAERQRIDADPAVASPIKQIPPAAV